MEEDSVACGLNGWRATGTTGTTAVEETRAPDCRRSLRKVQGHAIKVKAIFCFRDLVFGGNIWDAL